MHVCVHTFVMCAWYGVCDSGAIFVCVSGYIYLYVLLSVCVCVCMRVSMLGFILVWLCNVRTPECVSGLRAISSPVSISIFLSLLSAALRDWRTVFVLCLGAPAATIWCNLTRPFSQQPGIILLTPLSSQIHSRISCWRSGASGKRSCHRGHQMGSRSVSLVRDTVLCPEDVERAVRVGDPACLRGLKLNTTAITWI